MIFDPIYAKIGYLRGFEHIWQFLAVFTCFRHNMSWLWGCTKSNTVFVHFCVILHILSEMCHIYDMSMIL